MCGFNNEAYQALVNDLINDAFYIEGASYRGIIAKIRQYAEVVVRKILNLSPDETVELGNGKLQHKLKEKNNPLLLNAVKKINKIGSECTHTKSIREISKEEVNDTINRLFELYASLLIDYFEKYQFGSNPHIVYSFSMLPPIIRYITLNYLYDKYPDNLIIIDKLSLILLKALNREAAINWLETHKDVLEKTPTITEKAYQEICQKGGVELANLLCSTSPQNMYVLCCEKVNLLAKQIDKVGLLYNDFESAIVHYRENGIVKGSSSEVMEFNSIMEFLYLGRKAQTDSV